MPARFTGVAAMQTYTIVGSDGQSYGPVSLIEMKVWIREGRINADTQVSRSDMGAWRPASYYGELEMSFTSDAPAIAAAAVPGSSPVISAAMLELEKKSRSGASWFYWIAGLSAVNAIAFLMGGDWSFFFGLGSLQIISALAGQMDSIGTMIAIGLNVIGVALFVLLGVFAYKKHSWAFLVGLILYGLDSLCYLLFMDYLGLFLHLLALWFIFCGFRANRQWEEMQNE